MFLLNFYVAFINFCLSRVCLCVCVVYICAIYSTSDCHGMCPVAPRYPKAVDPRLTMRFRSGILHQQDPLTNSAALNGHVKALCAAYCRGLLPWGTK